MKTMKQLGFLGITTLIAVTAATVLEYTMSSQNPPHGPVNSDTLFPSLFPELKHITKIKVADHDQAFSIEKNTDGTWTLPSDHGYPASAQKVKKILWGIADLKKIATKTKNPELLPELGLEDPKSPDANSKQLILEDQLGHALAGLIIGKTPHQKTGSSEAFYVRKTDESQAYLVAGDLPVETQSLDWADRQLTQFDERRMATITVTDPQNGTLQLSRKDPEQHDLDLVGLSTKEKISSHFTVNNVASALARLTFEKVVPATTLGETKPVFQAHFKTFDGTEMNMQVMMNPAKEVFARLSASLTDPAPDVKPEFPLKTKEIVEKEVSQFNALHEKWAYQIPAYQLEDIHKTKKELITTT